MNLTVIGAGYVGLSLGLCLAGAGHQVLLSETDEKRYLLLRQGICPISEPLAQELLTVALNNKMLMVTSDQRDAISFGRVIWIAVNTPMGENGGIDLKDVHSAISAIKKYGDGKQIIAIKSTVPVSTCRTLYEDLYQNNFCSNLVFCPEFLREGQAIHDILNPSRVIIGTHNDELPQVILDLYKDMGIPEEKLVITGYENAEMSKLASNSFLATKLSFINELACYCSCIGADIGTVTHCMGLDERISAYYMHPGLGYGGACLPKDGNSLFMASRMNGVPLTVLGAAIKANAAQSDKVAQIIYDNAPRGGTLAVWGLSFKPESGDMRCSPAVSVLRSLSKLGDYSYRIFDPYIQMCGEELSFLKNAVSCSSMSDAANGADALVILTAHRCFFDLKPVELKSIMHGRLIFDFFYRLNKKALFEAGFIYIAN